MSEKKVEETVVKDEKPQALVVVEQALKVAVKRGAFELEEVEVILQALKVLK